MAGEAEAAARSLAEQHGLRYIDLTRTVFTPGAASMLPEDTARRFKAVPVERRRGVIVIAMADPGDPLVMNAMGEAVGGDFLAMVAPADQVGAAVSRLYGSGPLRTRPNPPEPESVTTPGPPQAAPAPLRPQIPDFEIPMTLADGQAGRPAQFATADALLSAASGNGSLAGGDAATGGTGLAPETSAALDDALRNALALPDLAADAPGGSSGAVTIGAPSVSLEPNGTGPVGRHEAGASVGSPATVAPPVTASVAPPVSAVAPAVVAPAAAAAVQTNGAGLHGATVPTPAEIGQVSAPVSNGNGNGSGTATLTLPEAPPVDFAVPAPVSAPSPTFAPVGATEKDAATPPPPPSGYGHVPKSLGEADAQWPPLARSLVASGRVSYEAMVNALQAHRESGDSLARYLFNHQMATEDDLVRAMAEEVGLEFVDLGTYPIDVNSAGLIPSAVARRHMVLPIRVEGGVPVVAMANPTDVFAMDDLRTIMGRVFTPVVATRTQIAMHLRQLSEPEGDVEGAAQDAAGTIGVGSAPSFELESLQSVAQDAPVVRYVNLLILQALNERASDIHIEPTPRRLRIRFRIDGVMHDASSASPAIHPAVVSRLKVLAEMDITEHRLPQEGRVSVSVGDRQIDLRIATLPSLYGETVVMRLLDKTASIRRLSDLGFLPDTLERYAHSYNHPYGVILVTGPTGAGKTTTLYATLQEVMNKEKSVVTVEDPVEYQIDGITQVQINNKAGLQFGTALRSILRADPDIVLVGEIRDIDTASIAMEAALSGHLVLSTLHTNTAASTPLRLTEMGIEPFLVTSAVSGVLTQRLARVLCERCKTAYDASLADFYAAGYREVDLEGLDVSTLYRANGCRTCGHTGYYGRMVLAEVMPVTEDIERMIIEQQSIVAMERVAVEQGMRTLRQDGLVKAIAGNTTLEEVLRVVV